MDVINKQHLQAITTRYCMTNTRGTRTIASAAAGRLIVNYDNRLNMDDNHIAAAKAFCAKFGWDDDLAHGVLASGDHVFVQVWR